MNVICPTCQTANRQVAQFCQKCGGKLAQEQSPLGSEPFVLQPDSSATGPISSGTAANMTIEPISGDASPPRNELTTMPVNMESVGGVATADSPAAPQPAEQLQEIAAVKVAVAPTILLPSAPSFDTLSDGALLQERRYQIVQVLKESPKLNVYAVIDRVKRYCIQCGARENGSDDEFCAECGVTLPKTPVPFWLRETSEADMWERHALMVAHKLWHPGLVNVYDVFEHRPYGDLPRFYLITDAEDGEMLKTQSLSEDIILSWGLQLADSVSYLHSKGFRHRNISIPSVRLVDGRVKLTNFEKAEKVARAESKGWKANEVADLARLLRDDISAGQKLSPTTAAVFDKALSSDMSARYATAEEFAADLAAAADALARVDSMALLVGRLSHVGEVRDHNEDSLLTIELQRTQLSEGHPLGIYILADGMGGHAAGEIASGTAINTAAKFLVGKLMVPWLDDSASQQYDALLKEAFQKANSAVYEHGRKGRTDMGTTLVGALVVGDEAYVANIGDSRCYHINSEGLCQVTTDHSLVERLIAAGTITREEARTHPQRNYIYRTVGDKPQCDVDVFKVHLKPGDFLALCSDGLSGMVEDAQIHEVVLGSPNPQVACEKLIQLANAAGGDDNVTAIVVQVVAAIGNRP